MAKRLGELDVGVDVALADKLLVQQGGVDNQVAASELPLPFNYIGGLNTSNGTDANNDIDIAVGAARAADDSTNLRLLSALTKQIDAAWAVGTDAGGMDTGAVAATSVYALWLIKRSDTGVVDALFSLSFTAPTMPTDYDSKRLIATVITVAGAVIMAYTQVGDEFELLGSYPLDVNDSSITSATYEVGTLSAPPKSMARVIGQLANPSSTGALDGVLYMRPVGSTQAPSVIVPWMLVQVDANSDYVARAGTIFVDSSRQMEYAASELSGSASLSIHTTGFKMLTRRDP